jgi:hypothetical protein
MKEAELLNKLVGTYVALITYVFMTMLYNQKVTCNTGLLEPDESSFELYFANQVRCGVMRKLKTPLSLKANAPVTSTSIHL